MLRSLFALVMLCIGVAADARLPASWPTEHFVAWNPAWGTRTINTSGLQVRVEARMCGDRRPVSEACAAGDRYTVVTVTAPDMQPATLDGAAGVAWYIGIGKLGAVAIRPSVILITEDGGSNGCVQFDVATPGEGGYRAGRLSVTSSDHGIFCEVEPSKLAWPRDLTGHGQSELLTVDAGWHCAFTSCAASWYPPRVIALDGARGIDVSDDPALAPIFRADMQRARDACEHRIIEAQGACAGFAADAARVGQLGTAWRIIETAVQQGCRVRTATECYPDNRIPPGFPAQLKAALQRGGYTRGR